MSAKQGIGSNKIKAKRLCLLGILSCVCLIFGFIESLIPFGTIAPGVKIGLANSVALTLVLFGDIKGAFAVNITRIILSSLLFSSPSTLIFALPAGVCSLFVGALFSKIPALSGVGIGVISAFVHNIVQILVAYFLLGSAVFYYLPFLLVSALISGGLIGIICNYFSKKLKTNKTFYGIISF